MTKSLGIELIRKRKEKKKVLMAYLVMYNPVIEYWLLLFEEDYIYILASYIYSWINWHMSYMTIKLN